jgi:hypothetical protein
VNHLYTIVALDIARDRAREADMSRRAALARQGRTGQPGIVRRSLANGFALVSRGSAAAVRRLDDGIGEDLGRALATGK